MIDHAFRTLPSPRVPTIIDTGLRGSANDVTSITLATPATDEFWLMGSGVGGSASWYIPGADQDGQRVGEMITQGHQGSSGWQSVALSTHRLVNGVAWPGTLNLNMGSTTSEMALAMKFRTRGPWLGISESYVSGQLASANVSITCSVNSNPHLVPGGVCFVAAYQNPGGAGPTSHSGQGWVVEFVGLLAVGYYILPLNSVMTPPPVTITSARSATWAYVTAYLR